LVVYTGLRISIGKLGKGMSSPQARSHIATIAGYLPRQGR
jgi:hypothetical protein